MPRIVGLVGWLLAAGAAAGAGLLYVELEAAKTELQISREATDIVKVENTQLKSDNEELKQQVAMVWEKNRSLRNEGNVASADEALDAAALLDELMQGNADESGQSREAEGVPVESHSGPANPFFAGMPDGRDMMSAMGELMSSEGGKRFMERMGTSGIESTYGEFLDSLALTDEKRAEIADIFVRQQMSVGERMMGAFTGDDAGPGDVMLDVEQAQADLEAELSQALTPGQMQQYREYEQYLPFITTRRSYEMQLRRTGMSPESQRAAATVMAEEVLAQREAPGYEALSGPERRIQGMDNALARLSGTLSAEEYAEVEAVVERQTQLYESMRMFTPPADEGESMPASAVPVFLP